MKKLQLSSLYGKAGDMKTLTLLQWGKERSIVEMYFPDTKEEEIFIVDNQHLLNLDEMGMVI